ncbi:hypothetical protein Y032_0926g3070 [Ancylostoma ceylanicum]|uniref:Uncharacterized protein n=1 Tax=Ancylostoma ceylanicum TaxID=53326 RepID=A0A016WA80_9BILA|nr:hypothetical protein Y032_0926g3070 [Ancylostoma ceylanicum]
MFPDAVSPLLFTIPSLSTSGLTTRGIHHSSISLISTLHSPLLSSLLTFGLLYGKASCLLSMSVPQGMSVSIPVFRS